MIISSKRDLVLVFITALVSSTLLFVTYHAGRLAEGRAMRKELATNKEIIDQKWQRKFENIEQELQLCYNDRAAFNETTTEEYDFSTFGVYSPLLEGKQVRIVTFTYRQATIVAKTVSIDDNSSITVWSLDKGSFELFSQDTGSADFPTFGGYENHGTPVMLSEIKQEWDERDVYKTKDGTVFHYRYHYAPKSIGTVSLDLSSTFSPVGPIFVEIMHGVSTYPGAAGENDPGVLEAKQKLKVIADSVSVKL